MLSISSKFVLFYFKELFRPHYVVKFHTGIEWPWRLEPLVNEERNGTIIAPRLSGDCAWNAEVNLQSKWLKFFFFSFSFTISTNFFL